MNPESDSRADGGGRRWMVRTDASLDEPTEAALASLEADRSWLLDSAEAWAEFGEAVSEAPPGSIVAVGGDGTIQGVVRAIGAGAGVVLGIVPAGTGNDFARALGVPMKAEAAVERVRAGRVRAVDLLAMRRDGGKRELIVNAVTIGLSGAIHAELDDETKERWGRFAYLRAALRASSELEPFPAALEVADAPGDPLREFWSGRLLHISLANGPNAGGGVPIAPGAEVDDGRLDVCGVAEGEGWEIGLGVPEVLGAGDPGEPWLLASAGRVVLRMEEARPASVDGETGDVRTVELEVLPGALTVYGGED